ncbi:MAG: amidohydrolase [Deltaproteobacteria bacterium]|nr:amidohydrolase [Deltaproteobacteria bacterium]
MPNAAPQPLTLEGLLWRRERWTPGALVLRGGRVAEVLPPGRSPRGVPVFRADRVTPGLVDGHGHPSGLGRQLGRLDLRGCASLDEALSRVASAPGDGWILGEGWDQERWEGRPWPTAEALEGSARGRPCYLRRVDGHAAWVSEAALRLAGLAPGTPDPPGGRLLRHPDGRLTGVLLDTAMRLIRPPRPTPADRERDLARGAAHLADLGLTGIHVMGAGDEELAAALLLEARGALPLRLWLYALPESEAAARLVRSGPWGQGLVRVVGVKLFADGALGSRGAWLSEDYADAPGERGLSTLPDEALDLWLRRADDGRFGLAVHAIGDRAARQVLDARERSAARPPLRLEHAQIVRPEDLGRLRRLAVTPSFQPLHGHDDRAWAEDRLGPRRMAWAYRWADLVREAHSYVLGSDLPIARADPWEGLSAATREPWPGGWPLAGPMPRQRLTEAQALRGYTTGPAQAVGERGPELEPGARADLSLWRVDSAGRWHSAGTVLHGALRPSP